MIAIDNEENEFKKQLHIIVRVENTSETYY